MKAIHFTYEDKNHLPYVSVGEPVWRVWRKMKRMESPFLAVVNGRALVGIVRERDIRLISQVHGGESADVTEVMIPNPLLFAEQDLVEEVLAKMLNDKLEFVVLVDQDQQALKVISVHEIIKYVLSLASKSEWGHLKNLLENHGEM